MSNQRMTADNKKNSLTLLKIPLRRRYWHDKNLMKQKLRNIFYLFSGGQKV